MKIKEFLKKKLVNIMNKILILILILILIFILISKMHIDFFSVNNKYKGLCAFDIDGTITTGSSNNCLFKGKKYDKNNGGCTLAAIDACKDKKFAIAVNTASIRDRDTYCCEVGMCSKGKKGKCLVSEKNWWNNYKYKKKNYKCGSNHGGCGKAYIMKKLYESNNISEPRTAILWDDYHANLSAAYSAGWGVIPMPNIKKCTNPVGNGKFDKGITQEQIDLFLNNSFKKWKPCKNFHKTNCSNKTCSQSNWYSQHFDPNYSF